MEFFYHEVDRSVLVIAADGGLNNDTIDEFIESVEKLLSAGVERIIVDCDHLDYISSRGVATLLMLHRRMEKRGGDVRLANVRGAVGQIIQTLNLDGVFQMYPTVERAMLSFRKADKRSAGGDAAMD